MQGGGVKGIIGILYGAGVPGYALIRYLCSRFLLAGHSGSLLGERTIRVSAKVLVLNCLTRLLAWLPDMMQETLYIHDTCDDSIDLVQRIWDVTRYSRHADPSVVAATASVIGHYLRAVATQKAAVINAAPQQQQSNNITVNISSHDSQEDAKRISSSEAGNNVSDAEDGHGEKDLLRLNSLSCNIGNPVGIDSLLDVLKEVLSNESAVVARGGITAIRTCLPALLQCLEVPAALSVLPQLVAATKHPYWLNKVELCEALAHLPLTHVDFLEQECAKRSNMNGALRTDNERPLWGVLGIGGHFSHRVLQDALLPLLPDPDPRVRSAAVKAIVRLANPTIRLYPVTD